MEDSSSVIHSLKLNTYLSYFLVASPTFLVYDHFLTLGDEIHFVWSSSASSWSLGKVLFFLTRYSPFVETVLSTYRLGMQSPPTSTCHLISTVNGWASVFGLLIAEVIMGMRVWALWNQSRWIGFGLASITTIFLTISSVMVTKFSSNYHYIDMSHIISPVPPGCFPDVKSNLSYVAFLLLMTLEMIMLSLTVVKGIQDLGYHPSSFLYKFYKDGVLYYVILSTISLMNVVVLLVGPPELSTILLFPQRCLHSILTSRILLRLREDASLRKSLLTLTEPVGDSIFVTTGSAHGGVSSRGTSWFGDANSNVAGGEGL